MMGPSSEEPKGRRARGRRGADMYKLWAVVRLKARQILNGGGGKGVKPSVVDQGTVETFPCGFVGPGEGRTFKANIDKSAFNEEAAKVM